MRLGYFAMPVHPLHRNYTETLKEDRAAIIFCDELGYYDAFMGEHLSDAAENITSSMLFHATLIHSTKQIKLATEPRTCRISIRHWWPPMLRCSIIWPRAVSSWASARVR